MGIAIGSGTDIAIEAADIVLIPILGPSARLGPGIAAPAVALSSLFVMTNSARLWRFNPREAASRSD